MKRMRLAAVMLAAVLAAGGAWANNLVVTNVTVTPKDATTAYVQFDLSWENSWRYAKDADPLYYHDAAWVFFKVQPQSDTTWTNHVKLHGTGIMPEGYSGGSGTPIQLVVPTDRVGLFVRRSADDHGALAATGVTAVWNLADSGVLVTNPVKITALAIEMVYVAEGAFKVGSAGAETGRLYEGGGGNDPFLIASAGQIECGDETGKLWGSNSSATAGNDRMGGVGTISGDFPNGYAAFYCMKYEITQGQYADFLNLLTRDQQATRCTATNTLNNYMHLNAGGSAAIVNRNTVRLTTLNADPVPRVYTTTSPDRACNWISWADVAAYTDWAGLRPMTELEFEKACRGPATLPSVANEYAWGASSIMSSAKDLSGAENGTETVTTATTSGAAHYGNPTITGGDGGTGPLRAGIFAKDSSDRVNAGASYWGIMELSGSLGERPVTVGRAEGRLFDGLHGDGMLASPSGDANVANWPPGTDALGAGWRGGTWTDVSAHACVSARHNAANAFAARSRYLGGRAVRSAP